MDQALEKLKSLLRHGYLTKADLSVLCFAGYSPALEFSAIHRIENEAELTIEVDLSNPITNFYSLQIIAPWPLPYIQSWLKNLELLDQRLAICAMLVLLQKYRKKLDSLPDVIRKPIIDALHATSLVIEGNYSQELDFEQIKTKLTTVANREICWPTQHPRRKRGKLEIPWRDWDIICCTEQLASAVSRYLQGNTEPIPNLQYVFEGILEYEAPSYRSLEPCISDKQTMESLFETVRLGVAASILSNKLCSKMILKTCDLIDLTGFKFVAKN